MYGSLHEFDIRSLLELIERNQGTGQLLVETAHCVPTPQEGERQFWLISLKDGQIAYATDNNHLPLQRLQDYLRRYQVESALERLPTIESIFLPLTSSAPIGRALPEYNHLWLLLERHVLEASQGKKILESMIHETLFDLLSLDQGYFVFESNTVIQPQLATVEIGMALSKVTREIQQWKQLYPYITSPEQCPLLTKSNELKQALTPSAYRSLAVACQGELSLRRIARYLKKDLLTISHALYPYIQRGWLHLLDPAPHPLAPSPSAALPKVVCVDEKHELSDQMGYLLEQQGYEKIIVNDPIEALSVIVRSQPSLILSPLEMSIFSGEELCHCLRSLPAFVNLPIILFVPEHPDPLRLAKARLLGVTEFLYQPVQESQFLWILRQYLGEAKSKGQ